MLIRLEVLPPLAATDRIKVRIPPASPGLFVVLEESFLPESGLLQNVRRSSVVNVAGSKDPLKSQLLESGSYHRPCRFRRVTLPPCITGYSIVQCS